LAVSRNEKEISMLGKVEAFIHALEGATPQTASTVAQVADVVEPLTEGKKETYWRDVTVGIITLKHVFENTPFGEEMAKLRQLIHDGEMGKEDYSAEFENISLEIKQGDSDDIMLGKLTQFIKAIKRKHESKFKPTPPREGIEEPKDRKKIWAEILAGLVAIKKAFKGTNFGTDVAKIKDLIDDYKIGYEFEYSLDTEWGISLKIDKGEDLDNMVKKLAEFIEAVQKANPDRFDETEAFSADKVVEQKEARKIYWQDVIAGLDVLQKTYTAKEYPAIQALREMIENNELAMGNSLLMNVGPIILDVKKTDNDKAIKNKIAVFIGELKQIAPSTEVLTETYWRDILAQLHGMEDSYGDNPDYQMLIMTIEMGTLATVRDFQISIDGVELEITIKDTDQIIKEKLSEFIKILRV